MTNPIRYQGWERYSDTGTPYRFWTLNADAPGLGGWKDDELHDRGPDDSPNRFRIFRRVEGKWISVAPLLPEEEILATLKIVMSWTPPAETFRPKKAEAALSPDARALLSVLEQAIGALKPVAALQDAFARVGTTTRELPPAERRPRGVYVMPGAGRWGRRMVVAHDSSGQRIDELELQPDDTPEEVAVIASAMQRKLDESDPVPDVDPAEVIERLISGAAMETVPEQEGWRMLPDHARREHWNQRMRRARARIREEGKDCTICGEHYRPRRVDQLRCPGCIKAGRKAQP